MGTNSITCDQGDNEFVTLPRAQYEFIRLIAFGDPQRRYVTASKLAYHDLQRTLRYGNKDEAVRRKLRESVDVHLKKEIQWITSREEATLNVYDDWHKRLCDDLARIYREKDITFHLGQAQKWVNMAIKYLYAMQTSGIERYVAVLHVPIDNYIYQQAEEELHVPRIDCCWSKIDSYEQYIDYQNAIRKAVETVPLLWEFEAWQRATSSR